jgi:hypothetical protein
VAGEATLWVPIYRNWTFDGLASLDREEAAQWLRPDRLPGFRPEHVRVEPVTCSVQRLDDLGLAPTFIKLDVQGCELQVLKGGEATLRRHRPMLMLETPEQEREIAFLAELGYEVCAYEDGRIARGRTGRLNSFFLQPEHFALAAVLAKAGDQADPRPVEDAPVHH